jgi:subtilisin family serine protease
MNKYEHLPLSAYQGEVQRQTRGGGGGYKLPKGRNKNNFTAETTRNVDNIINTFSTVKNKYSGIVNPSLIFELEINQSVDYKSLEKTMSSMGIHILLSAENRKGYWVVFSDDENLHKFKIKLATYGSEDGPKYDFFNAFGNLRDIPKEEKIGERLIKQPLGDAIEYIDIELWRMMDETKNNAFIEELKVAYPDRSKFRITDQLITKSFVLLRVKLSKKEFDEIIDLKEIARADRPSLPTFNPFELKNLDILEIEKNAPNENATGILIIDSGIISNHPLLEKCIGGEDNFQSSEIATNDTVGHGTAVASCAAYGDVEKCIIDKVFTPSNWIFSAKLMYAETNPINGEKYARYDPDKLVEHQLRDAIFTYLSNSDYHIHVVNISIGNIQEVWHQTYTRQLPLAALIDELAYTFPQVVFIVSTGNQNPQNIVEFDTIEKIKTNYPKYLLNNSNFKLINPATSALAITVGSISPANRIQQNYNGEEQIKISIAEENQPSPFTRTGPGINIMVKPELVEYGGNLILYNNYGRISEDSGGKIALLNNETSTNLIKFDYGTSFSAPKVARIAGEIANLYPQRTANFIINMLLSSAGLPFIPKDDFYGSKEGKAIEDHLNVCGYGLPSLERAINSFDNRVILFDEGKLQLNRVKVYSLQLPDVFFNVAGYKRIIINLSFTPETRSTRGDSYMGNRMEFHMFHSVNPQELINKYGVVSAESEGEEVPDELKTFEIKLIPGTRKRNAGCHQKAWKEFKREPRNSHASPVSLVLINYNKWTNDENIQTDFCLSVTFEHEVEIDLYNQIRANIQTRARIR